MLRLRTYAYYALLFVLLFHILIVCLLCDTPPISRDALIHHLAIPKLWLNHGGFYEIPWAEYSYYPMNIEVLYLVSLYFKNDIAPKFIHFVFGLGTGLLVFCYLKQRFDRIWGLLGMIIFITTPIVVWLSTSAYVDLGMTFFTTGSILSFTKWRGSGYGRLKWLIISSSFMGMALGTKYNALIVWFFLNLMIAYYYAKDTRRQLPALKYGFVFFTITLLIASPWYIKNYLLTGNPFYPLFESFFRVLHKGGGGGDGFGAIVQTLEIDFFQRRRMMYGESFWMTILIPVRMFFQGSDDSYRYFQGVLNPILIIFLPFAVIDRSLRKDTILFMGFSGFFIFMVYFLTAKQVRYILPVIPFLSILAVVGIKNVADMLRPTDYPFRSQSGGVRNVLTSISRLSLFAIVVIFLTFNLSYLKNRFDRIQPLKYVLRKETRDAFLRRHLASYPAIDYINQTLSADDRIYLFFLGRRGYYLDRPYRNEHSFGMATVNRMVSAAKSKEEFEKFIQSLNCTHILMRTDMFVKYLVDNFSKEEIVRFLSLIKESWKLLYESNGYALYSLCL